ncbi:MAG: CotH kinase family protein [Deltaproteobacteria bacterium]|nr:CotH kinase family protein [Deltaproteobacteria bacterium]
MLPLLACAASIPGPAGEASVASADDTAADTAAELVGGPEEIDPSDAVFDASVVHRIDIEIDPAAWYDIQYNYAAETWWTADFSFDGETVTDVGIRAFGAGSQVAGKTPIKLSFDRVVDGQEFRGLEQLKLDGSTQDAGFLNDPLAAWVLRELDLPAARMSWATVYANGEQWGFYVVMEPIDDVFLRRHFEDDEGPLYGTWDWRYGQGLNPITWGGPLDWYVPQTNVETDGSDIVAAMTAVASGSDEELAATVETEPFQRISATRAMMGAIDMFAADGNNFYLYNHQGRITMIPWDMDADLGYPGYFINAVEMGLEEPWLWSHARYNPVTGALYSDPLYARTLAQGWDLAGWVDHATSGPLDWATIDAKVVECASTIHDAACEDSYHGCGSHERRVADLRMFLHTRLSRIAGAEVADCPGPTSLSFSSGGVVVPPDATYWGPGFVVNGEHHCNGVYAGAPATLVTTVEAGTLSGAVGQHDWVQYCSGTSVFSVSQGGVVLWQSEAVGPYASAVPFEVSVAAGEVTLSTTLSGNCAAASWVGVGQ